MQVPTAKDSALTPEMCFAPGVLDAFPGGNLEIRVVDGDHWVLQDELRRDEVNEVLMEFVGRVMRGEWRPRGRPVAKL